MSDRGARLPVVAGLLAALAALALVALLPERTRAALRESVFDLALAIGRGAPRASPRPVVIVDIDRRSLAEAGAWPWPRGTMAELTAAALAGGAAAVAFDVLFAGPDQRSPGTIARRLAQQTGDAAIARIAETLPDGDRTFAAAMHEKPVALSFVLDPRGGPMPAAAPVLDRGAVRLGGLWAEAGAQPPIAELAGEAAGLGAASLPGDADGVIRRVPLLVGAGGAIAPGLAAEAVRVAAEASAFMVAGPPARLVIGDFEVALPPDGMLRLLPASAAPTPVRILAADLLAGRVDGAALRKAIVLVGASAPELGGLRASLLGPLTPSVDLQALAAWQIMAGVAPVRAPEAELTEAAAGLALALMVVLLAARSRPLPAAGGVFALAAASVAAVAGAAGRDVLFDPTAAFAAGTFAFAATSLVRYAQARRREAAVRRRFEQHLAPGVVERIAAAPDSLRLLGEKRRITALFTDIEGFSETVSAAAPEELIAVLDGYFEGVASIVVRNGGMIDKFVGDAVHAFFNMPLDVESHADRAVACAVEIVRWTERHRRDGLAGRIRLGRTRIGIETGDAVVGDVGLSTKLDYTAHGGAVNLAARLELLNKQLGTAICVGPGAAEACASVRLRSLGVIEVRGFGPLALHTPIDA
jgi:adenylate cyclase